MNTLQIATIIMLPFIISGILIMFTDYYQNRYLIVGLFLSEILILLTFCGQY
jgi:hypothetical protein